MSDLSAYLADLKQRIDQMPVDETPNPDPHWGRRNTYRAASGLDYQCAWPEEVVRAMKNAIGIPRNLIDCTLDNYRTDTAQQRAMWDATAKWVERAAQSKPGMHSLFIGGPTGIGKSHLAVAACKEIIGFGRRPVFEDGQELLTELRQWDSDALTRCIEADVLLIDDLTANKATDAMREKIQILLHKRHAETRSTILTTNHPFPESVRDKTLKDLLGHRIISRIYESYVMAQVEKMDDYRKTR